jgi:hypothetical protein
VCGSGLAASTHNKLISPQEHHQRFTNFYDIHPPDNAGYEMNFRYTPLLLGLLVGIAIGILYGWVIQPIESRETSPRSLQDQYQADVVLMIAEIFAAEEDIELARQRMSNLSLETYGDIVANALNYAKAHDFSDQDIEVLSNLAIHINRATSLTETGQP